MRGLTSLERRELLSKTGYTLTNFEEGSFEKVMMATIDMVYPEKPPETFDLENKAFEEIIKLTYSVSEKDAKN